jgi:hypothetical protein
MDLIQQAKTLERNRVLLEMKQHPILTRQVLRCLDEADQPMSCWEIADCLEEYALLVLDILKALRHQDKVRWLQQATLKWSIVTDE